MHVSYNSRQRSRLGSSLHIFQYEESSCLQVALAARVADHLRDAKTGAAGLHVDKLGAATGIPAPKLARVLRMLATDHIFCEGECRIYLQMRMKVLTMGH